MCRWINAKYWPCLGVKVFPERLTPAIRFSWWSVPQHEEARMNVPTPINFIDRASDLLALA